MAPAVPIAFTRQKESMKFSHTHMMRVSRIYSKGHSVSFVPGQHVVVETMGESEGFGCSGRVDTEMTASDDSYAPERKSISLNGDGYDYFDLPVQVLSLSKILPSEMKDLELRLKLELKQVRVLREKIAFLTTDVALSPSSDIRSCSDGLKRPAIENIYRSSDVSAPQGKRRAPPGHNGVRRKRVITGRSEPQRQAAPASYSNAAVMKQCETLLSRLMGHQFGWVFNSPVDVVKLNIPDYFTVIKHPMDLGTVKNILTSGQYSCPMKFVADVRLTFSNAVTYNPSANDVHFMAETLSKFFEVRWKYIEKKFPGVSETHSVPSRSSAHFETEIVAVRIVHEG